MGAGRWRIFRRVVVPSALPQIFAGLRVSLALSFIVMFAAEMINARSGLGQMIRIAENSLRFDLMYVSLVAIAILGYAARPAAVRRAQARARLAGRAGMSRLMPLLIVIPALIAWEAASRSGLWSPLLFPLAGEDRARAGPVLHQARIAAGGLGLAVARARRLRARRGGRRACSAC